MFVYIGIVALLWSGLGSWPQAVRAAEWQGTEVATEGADITASFALGIGGYTKKLRFYPMQVTLQNNTDAEISGGVLKVFLRSSGSLTDANNLVYKLTLDLPRGTQVQAALPVYNGENGRSLESVRLYAENGRELARWAGEELAKLQTFTQDDTLVGVVSDDVDTLSFLAGYAVEKQLDVRLIPMQPAEVPGDERMLDMLDALVINNVPAAAFRAEQLEAILGWGKSGGRLVLSGGTKLEQTVAGFAGYVPFTLTGGQMNVETLYTGAADAEDRASLLFPWLQITAPDVADIVSPLTVYEVTLHPNADVLWALSGERGVPNTPLVASAPFGHGMITGVFFNPQVQPAAAWRGSGEVWHAILGLQGPDEAAYRMPSNFVPIYQNSYRDDDANFYQTLAFHMGNNTPAQESLSYDTMIFIFMVYLLLVTLGLFIVLRRWDRLMWAWWLIPVISVICSGVLLSVGLSQNNQSISSAARVVEMSPGTQTAAAMSEYRFIYAAGGGTVTRQDPARVAPLYGRQYAGTQLAEVDAGLAQTTTKWNNIPYRSSVQMTEAWASTEVPGGLDITATLSQSGTQTTIAITNNLAIDLDEVYVVWNNDTYRAGQAELAAGASVNLNLDGTSGTSEELPAYLVPSNDVIYNALYKAYGDTLTTMNQPPFVVGFSMADSLDGTLSLRDAEVNVRTMWVQQVPPPQPWEDKTGEESER
jgi:hypothetical protein